MLPIVFLLCARLENLPRKLHFIGETLNASSTYLVPRGLGIMSPGIMTGVGGASLDWVRRRRVTPVQTTSQEAWPEAEPLGWNNSLR